mgnify:CR=1 FL=1
MSLQNNTLSRAELNDEFGAAQNIHYGDVLIKYDEILDVSKEPLSYIEKQSIADKFKTSYLQNGDVIIADTAEDETVGKCTEIEGLTDQRVISGLHTMPVRPNRKFASGFLGFYLNSAAYHDQLKPLMQGIKVTSISKGAMQDTVVKFPLDLKEQEQIGIYFGGLDHLITLHQRQPFLHSPPDISLIVQLTPPFYTFSWEQRKLGDVVQITMGQSPDGSTYSDEPSDYILVQGNADLQNGWVCPRIWTTQITKKADAGDLIMSVRAPAGAMGKTAYNAVIGRGVAAIKGNEFIYQLLVKMNADGFWKTLSSGSTFESLNSDNIKNAEVKIPTTAEQIIIGGYFQQLDNLITLHQRQTIVYAVIRSIRKVFLAERQYFAPPMVRKSP